MCGRRHGKNFLTSLEHGRVRLSGPSRIFREVAPPLEMSAFVDQATKPEIADQLLLSITLAGTSARRDSC